MSARRSWMLELSAIQHQLLAVQHPREATAVMKLLRYGPTGREQPGLMGTDGQIRGLVGVVVDLAGDALSAASLDRLRGINSETLHTVKQPVRIGPCVGRVGKMMCIGLNYAEHAAETGAMLPKEPVLF